MSDYKQPVKADHEETLRMLHERKVRELEDRIVNVLETLRNCDGSELAGANETIDEAIRELLKI